MSCDPLSMASQGSDQGLPRPATWWRAGLDCPTTACLAPEPPSILHILDRVRPPPGPGRQLETSSESSLQLPVQGLLELRVAIEARGAMGRLGTVASGEEGEDVFWTPCSGCTHLPDSKAGGTGEGSLSKATFRERASWSAAWALESETNRLVRGGKLSHLQALLPHLQNENMSACVIMFYEH